MEPESLNVGYVDPLELDFRAALRNTQMLEAYRRLGAGALGQSFQREFRVDSKTPGRQPHRLRGLLSKGFGVDIRRL